MSRPLCLWGSTPASYSTPSKGSPHTYGDDDGDHGDGAGGDHDVQGDRDHGQAAQTPVKVLTVSIQSVVSISPSSSS